MAKTREIWVLPEINAGDAEIGKVSLGLLSAARYVADNVGGTVTALVLGDRNQDNAALFRKYGVNNVYIFVDPLLKHPSTEAYSAALLARIREDSPWLVIMGHTALGIELAPRLAALLDTGAVTGCAGIDLASPENPRFYRFVYGDQLYQEVVFQTAGTMLVTMDARFLNDTPAARTGNVRTLVIEPKLTAETLRTEHLAFLPTDFQTVDVTEAETVISAGMGAVSDDILPLVEELADLIEGTIGTTRPVVDTGKIPRERMIGQTGKVVSPGFYLALGISGASHHVGGIQDSGRIVSVNRDPQAPIFRTSDVSTVVDLAEVLPKLIERIKHAKSNGEIL